MDITGQIIAKSEVETGTSKAGKEWEKMTVVINDGAPEYSKDIAFQLFGKIVAMGKGLNIGDTVNVSYNIESREYNDKWYSNINAWKIEVKQSAGVTQEPVAGAPAIPKSGEPTDDLPF